MITKRIQILILLICAALITYSQPSGIGETKKSESTGINYILSYPDDYREESKYPTILFLHGGDRSNTRHHPSKYAGKAGIDFPFIVLAPHCTGGCSWSAVDFGAFLKEITDEVSTIDKDRIYLTGYSMGGYGSWSALSRFPEWFAAAAPIAGGGNTSEICNAKRVPTRAYHGNKDNVIRHVKSQEMISALQKCGGSAELITYDGVDHGSWPITYRDPDFYKWLLANNR